MIAGSSNGRTPPFGGGYWGSSPWPAVRGIARLDLARRAEADLTVGHDSLEVGMKVRFLPPSPSGKIKL